MHTASSFGGLSVNFDEVKNSLDELDSGIESIEELTAGTYEWEAAIRASN